MAKLDGLDEPRTRVLESGIGSLLEWQAPNIEKTVGPYDPKFFEDHQSFLDMKIEAGISKLIAYRDDQIAILQSNSIDDPENIRDDWKVWVRENVAAARKRNPPPWHAGGFGHPDYVADFDYWAKMPSFSIEEVLSLSIGIEPNHFGKKEIEGLRGKAFENLWPSLQFLLRRHEQLRRQFDPQRQQWKVSANRFLVWVREMEFEAHPEFIRLLEKHYAENVTQNASTGSPQRTDPREVDSIAQLFTAMAVACYDYKPGQARSPVTKDITELAASMGLTISEDTVRKYLRRGAEFISDDWEPD